MKKGDLIAAIKSGQRIYSRRTRTNSWPSNKNEHDCIFCNMDRMNCSVCLIGQQISIVYPGIKSGFYCVRAWEKSPPYRRRTLVDKIGSIIISDLEDADNEC